MPLSRIKTKLAPPPSQWQNCCVPVEVLLTQTALAVQKRKLLMDVLLFLAYIITFLVSIITMAGSQSVFMSNSRLVADIMYWDRALVPERVFSVSNESTVIDAQWPGEYVPGWAVRSWRQFETWVQTRLLYGDTCSGASHSGTTCALRPLMEQVRSAEFTSCTPYKQSEFERSLVCLGGVTYNCEQGASTDPGTCNAGQDQDIDTNPFFPLLPDNNAAVCAPQGLGIGFGCSYVSGCGWTNRTLDESPATIGFVFNTNPEQNVTLDPMSRIVSVTETLQNAGRGFPSFVSVKVQAESQLSGYMRVMGIVQTLPDPEQQPGSLIVATGFLAAFVILEMLLFVKRLIQHPRSLLTPWLVLDLVMIAFYVILFIALDNAIWSKSTFNPPPDASLQESCVVGDIAADTRNYSQLIGALIALSFIKVFRFMTLLPFSRLALNSLIFAIRKLTWALVIIAVVYFLNALACLVFFGPNSFPFRLLGGSIFSVLIVPEGFDVVFIAEQMQLSLIHI